MVIAKDIVLPSEKFQCTVLLCSWWMNVLALWGEVSHVKDKNKKITFLVPATRDQSSECFRSKGSEFRVFPQQGIRVQNVSAARDQGSECFLLKKFRIVPETRNQGSVCSRNKGSELRMFPQQGIRVQSVPATRDQGSEYFCNGS